jgi:cytochrome c-type biogenesis protein CcmE
MKTVRRRRLAIVIVIVAIVGVSWFGLRQYNCQQRHAAFGRQVEIIKRDAHAQIKLGTTKSDVARFYKEHNIPFTISESVASGSVETFGCAPFGCGSDVALIVVNVKLDETGAATEQPTVGAIYTSCL